MFLRFVTNAHPSLPSLPNRPSRHRLRPQNNPVPPLRNRSKHPPLVNHRYRFLRSVNNHSQAPPLVLLHLSMLVQPRHLDKVHLVSRRLHPHLASQHLVRFCLRSLRVLSGNLPLGNQVLLNQRLDSRRLVNRRCWDNLHLPLETQMLQQHQRLDSRLPLQQRMFPSLRLVNRPLANQLFLKTCRL